MGEVVELKVWRPVVTHPGLYEVSNLGRVRSYDRKWHRGRLLKPSLKRGQGYRYVALSVDGRYRTVKVSKLVAMVWCGPRPSLKHGVLHKDGVRTNDHASNL